ncbi:sorbitol dehydrogenase [Babesia caballi]|uniref:Sorbitol dehydrogenase n=1 Tax=Babesia caballi TaxID=5871 RepID=A0AAV4LWF5_BABCB|nr:sorbitol dehydrogenase [Babesia caballi]
MGVSSVILPAAVSFTLAAAAAREPDAPPPPPQRIRALALELRVLFKSSAGNVVVVLVDLVDVDVAVGGASEERVTLLVPAERYAPGKADLFGLLAGDFCEHVLVLQVPDLDHLVGGDTEPVVARREAERVDGRAGLEQVQAVAVLHVPEARDAVFAARGAQRAVGGNRGGGDGAFVARQVELEVAGGQFPHLMHSFHANTMPKLTFTTLSHPPETKTCSCGFGENLTHETQSLCALLTVRLHSDRVFHNLMVLSRLPEMMWRLSGLKSTL